MYHRIMSRMKVTALIPDELIEEVKTLSEGKNITDAVTIALREWVSSKKVRALSDRVKKSPLEFSKGFSASYVRKLNRRR
jgi:hypothetical protein